LSAGPDVIGRPPGDRGCSSANSHPKKGHAGIDRIKAGLDDAGIRLRQMNEADLGEIRRQLVDDPARTGAATIDRGQT
jgi:hypothetical protein